MRAGYHTAVWIPHKFDVNFLAKRIFFNYSQHVLPEMFSFPGRVLPVIPHRLDGRYI